MSDIALFPYDPYNWYWQIGDDDTRFWSSANSAYVTDVPEGVGITRIASEAELTNVLRPYGLSGPAPSPADVWVERDRRLAVGFDYDFGDERGVHHIGTTPEDNLGWEEVTTAAQALINGGQGDYVLTISTDTGIVQLTADEWQGVLLAAAQFRQPIWTASFALEKADPIPADYREDARWP